MFQKSHFAAPLKMCATNDCEICKQTFQRVSSMGHESQGCAGEILTRDWFATAKQLSPVLVRLRPAWRRNCICPYRVQAFTISDVSQVVLSAPRGRHITYSGPKPTAVMHRVDIFKAVRIAMRQLQFLRFVISFWPFQGTHLPPVPWKSNPNASVHASCTG